MTLVTHRTASLLVSLIAVSSALLEITCTNGGNPVEPHFKDPRTLRWTVDTIIAAYTFQTMLGTVWGSSSKDVYLTGFTSDGPGARLYHYDGTRWVEISMPRSTRGTYIISLIRGFSPNDIWLVGAESSYNFSSPPNFFDSTLVLHFDGSRWIEYPMKSREGVSGSLSAQYANNVWVGARKSLWNYKDGLWTRDTILLVTSSQGFCGIVGLAQDKSDNLFVNFFYRPIDAGPVEEHYFFCRKNGSWVLLDSATVQPSGVEYKWGYDNLWCSSAGEIYSMGNGIYKWNGTSWDLVVHGNFSIVSVTSSENGHLIAVGNYGTILDFNGTDWYQFPQFRDDNMLYTDVWTDGKEVFIAGYPLQGSYIVVLHGK